MPVRKLDPKYILELAAKLDPKKYHVHIEQNRDVTSDIEGMMVGPITTTIVIDELKGPKWYDRFFRR